jgi:hypothetical protein
MMIDYLEGEFRGRRYTIRPGRPGSEDQAGLAGPIFYTVEYGHDLTFIVMSHRHEAAAELGARVERLLERIGHRATGAAEAKDEL